MARTTSSYAYKGFNVRIVPRGVVHFGYEIRSRGGPPIHSPDAFVTSPAAFVAACRFIDEVDRRMGLGPSDGRPRDRE